VKSNKNINTGNTRSDIEGATLNQAMNPANTTNPIIRSSNFENAADKGSIRRGKYTLLIILAFVTRLFADSVNVEEK
jgi:hypothetical protein